MLNGTYMPFMESVVMLSVVMLNVVMMIVVMLSVMGPVKLYFLLSVGVKD
jgi:hypothetical protein